MNRAERRIPGKSYFLFFHGSFWGNFLDSLAEVSGEIEPYTGTQIGLAGERARPGRTQAEIPLGTSLSSCHERTSKGSPLIPRLVKTKQAAEYLAISQWKLRNLVQQGLIPYIEDGGGTSPWRFDVRDLDAYVERSRRMP